MSCKTCAYPQVLCVAVYCKKDPELRNLPASHGDLAGPPSYPSRGPRVVPAAPRHFLPQAMRLDTYHHLLSELGRRHKALAATPENGRFLRIFISADPVQKQFDLIQFQGATRSGLKAPAGQAYLVAENYQVDYSDNDGDYFSREFRGAYLVLQRADLQNYPARDAAIAKCELIAEQLLGALVEQLRVEHSARISVRDAWLEHIGPLADTSVGVRLNFTWSEPANEDLVYDETHFTA